MITVETGADGFDDLIRLAEEQLPGARQQPGFEGFYLLTDAETGKLITISLWETREQMEAIAQAAPDDSGIHHAPPTASTPRLETYEVTLQS